MHDRRRPDPQLGVFETLLVIDGRPIELDAHLDRLEASLAKLFPDRPAPDLRDVPRVGGHYGYSTRGTSGVGRDAGNGLGSMRVTVAPNDDGTLDAQVTLRGIERAPALDSAPVSLHCLSVAGGLGAHKWADRSLLDEAQADLSADALPLIVDQDGAVLEASRANIFAVRDGALFTPPLDGRILPGITRMRLIEAAGRMGIPTHEEELGRDDLLTAKEVFLTGSVRGVERVRSIDGEALAADGEVTAGLAADLLRSWTAAKVG